MKFLYVLFLILFSSSFVFAKKDDSDSKTRENTMPDHKFEVIASTTVVKKKVEIQKQTPAPGLKKEDKNNVEDEYSEVLVDNMESDSYDSYQESASLSENEQGIDYTGQIPFYYGSIKGVLNDGGKNILVFEDENGVITFVQIYFGKNTVKWTVLARMKRN